MPCSGAHARGRERFERRRPTPENASKVDPVNSVRVGSVEVILRSLTAEEDCLSIRSVACDLAPDETAAEEDPDGNIFPSLDRIHPCSIMQSHQDPESYVHGGRNSGGRTRRNDRQPQAKSYSARNRFQLSS